MAEDPSARRDALTRRIAAQLLDAGAAQIALRDLGAALGTSDRMLLYYFGTKAALVESALGDVADQLFAVLESSVPPGRYPPATMLRVMLVLLRSEPLGPAMRVWADLAARGARGEAPFDAIATRTTRRWLAWLAARIDGPEGERPAAAAALFAVIEGVRQIDGLVPHAADHIDATLGRLFG